MRLSSKLKKIKCKPPHKMGKGWKPHHIYVKPRSALNKRPLKKQKSKPQTIHCHTSKSKNYQSINSMGHESNTCKCKENSILGKLFLSHHRKAITLSFSKISYVVKSILNFNRLVCGCIHSWVLIYKKKQVNYKLQKKKVLLTGINLNTATMQTINSIKQYDNKTEGQHTHI